MNPNEIASTINSLITQVKNLFAERDALQMSLEEADELAICDIEELVKHLEAAPLLLRWQGIGLLQSKERHARCRYCNGVILSQSADVEVAGHKLAYCWFAQAKALAKKLRDRGKEPIQSKSLEECAFPDWRKP